MLDIAAPLFEGQRIRLTPLDHDKDPEIVAAWTHESEFMRLYSLDPVRPLTVEQVKKKFDEIDKQMEEGKRLFHFHLRTCAQDRLIGQARIQWVEWSNAAAWIELGIASPADRRQGYGTEAITLMLRFAFRELNLHRLAAVVPGYNQAALAFFARFGFATEVCRREAVNRGGDRWDLFDLALLRPEWEARHGSP